MPPRLVIASIERFKVSETEAWMTAGRVRKCRSELSRGLESIYLMPSKADGNHCGLLSQALDTTFPLIIDHVFL